MDFNRSITSTTCCLFEAEMTTPCFNEANYEMIKEKFGLSEEELIKHIEKLYEWLISQPHLPHDVDYITLQKFLVNAKFSREKAEKKLDAYFTIRHLVPYVFSNRDPLSPEIIKSNSCIYLGFLSGLTSDFARCAIVRLRDPEPDSFDMTSFLKRWYFLMDIWLREDKYVNKIYVIVDTKQTSVRHMVKISPKKVRENANCYQNVYPVGLEGVIFLNTCNFVRILLEKVLKPMLKSKISQRFHVYSDTNAEFINTLEKKLLPREYGGEGPTLEEINDKWINIVNRNREWLMSQGSTTTDETKRDKASSSGASSCAVM